MSDDASRAGTEVVAWRGGVAVAGGEAAISLAAGELRDGGVIALPTDTVYGLAAALDRPEALDAIYRIKGRAGDKSLPVLAASVDAVRPLLAAPVPERLLALGERCWPGPLTLAMPARPGLPGAVVAGDGTIGVRIPDHPVALALLRATGGAAAVTSANRSGHPPATTAGEVIDQIGAAPDLALVLDAGTSPGGVASTVAGERDGALVIHRVGGVSEAELRAAWTSHAG